MALDSFNKANKQRVFVLNSIGNFLVATIGGVAAGTISGNGFSFTGLVFVYLIAIGCFPFAKVVDKFELVLILNSAILGVVIGVVAASRFGYSVFIPAALAATAMLIFAYAVVWCIRLHFFGRWKSNGTGVVSEKRPGEPE